MKLTIVTPTYNQASFIRQTLDSLLAQTPLQFPVEYLIYDAVSTDGSDTIIKEYLPKLAAGGFDCHYVRESDHGQSDAINKGWKLANGDIVTYLNSDDYYEPNILNTVMQWFQDHPTSQWAYGGWKLVNQTGIPFHVVQPIHYDYNKLLHYCNIGQPSCFFRKSLLDEFGLLNKQLHLAMDYDLWLRFASKYPAGIIPQLLSNMRYHANAKSSALTTKQLWEVYRVGAQYTATFSWQRLMQRFYLYRGLLATRLKLSTIERGLD